MKEENGKSFVDELVRSSLMTKVANAARPRPGQSGKPLLPRSITDFMESRQRESTKGFMEIAPFFVKGLKRKGMKTLTIGTLRDCLQSTAVAKQYFPNISQERWTALGNGIVQKGKDENLDMSVVEHWLETRDEAAARVFDDSMFDGLEGLTADDADDTDEPNEPETAKAATA